MSFDLELRAQPWEKHEIARRTILNLEAAVCVIGAGTDRCIDYR